MRTAWLVVLGMAVLAGTARADGPPPPIAVASASLPSATASDAPAWKLLVPSGSDWCQAGPGTRPGEPLTIALAAPTAIASVEVTPANDSAINPIATVEVVADGVAFRGARGKDARAIEVVLSGAPVSALVVRATAGAKGSRDVNCINHVRLHTRPDAAVVVGVDAAAAAALWPSLQATRDAVRSCNPRALAAQLAFPFERSWYTMDQDGMKERSAKYKTGAAVAKLCRTRKLRSESDAMKLVAPEVESRGPGVLDVSEGGTIWSVELDGGRWRVRSFSMGG